MLQTPDATTTQSSVAAPAFGLYETYNQLSALLAYRYTRDQLSLVEKCCHSLFADDKACPFNGDELKQIPAGRLQQFLWTLAVLRRHEDGLALFRRHFRETLCMALMPLGTPTYERSVRPPKTKGSADRPAIPMPPVLIRATEAHRLFDYGLLYDYQELKAAVINILASVPESFFSQGCYRTQGALPYYAASTDPRDIKIRAQLIHHLQPAELQHELLTIAIDTRDICLLKRIRELYNSGETDLDINHRSIWYNSHKGLHRMPCLHYAVCLSNADPRYNDVLQALLAFKGIRLWVHSDDDGRHTSMFVRPPVTALQFVAPDNARARDLLEHFERKQTRRQWFFSIRQPDRTHALGTAGSSLTASAATTYLTWGTGITAAPMLLAVSATGLAAGYFTWQFALPFFERSVQAIETRLNAFFAEDEKPDETALQRV